MEDDTDMSCPLCMEPFELDDKDFLPCACGYQICRFCWNRLANQEDCIETGKSGRGLCPACRQEYPESPVGFNSNVTVEALAKNKKKKKKQAANKQKATISQQQVDCNKKTINTTLKKEDRLAGLRVVQKNLVFVIGIPTRLTLDDLRKEFGKYGKIHKLVLGSNINTTVYTVYVTYSRPEDAIRAIQALNQQSVYCNGNNVIINGYKDGKVIKNGSVTVKASLGTTKYCNHWLKNQQCPKLPDCMYLHELAESEASFTKEEMQQGKHTEYEKKLIQHYLVKKGSNLTNVNNNNVNINGTINNQNHSSGNHNSTTVTNNNANNQKKNVYTTINTKNSAPSTVKSQFTLQQQSTSPSRDLQQSNGHIDSDSEPRIESKMILSRSENLDHSKMNDRSVKMENGINVMSRIHMNTIDEIIGGMSGDSSSFSTCSSGSYAAQLLTSSQICENDDDETSIDYRLPNGSTGCGSSSSLASSQIDELKDLSRCKSPDDESMSSPSLNTIDDDGLDFDPIMISTTGLQKLLRSCDELSMANSTSSSSSSNSSSSSATSSAGFMTPMTTMASSLPGYGLLTPQNHTPSNLHQLHQLQQQHLTLSHHLRQQVVQAQQHQQQLAAAAAAAAQSQQSNGNLQGNLPAEQITWRESFKTLFPNMNITHFIRNPQQTTVPHVGLSSNTCGFYKQPQTNQQIPAQFASLSSQLLGRTGVMTNPMQTADTGSGSLNSTLTGDIYGQNSSTSGQNWFNTPQAQAFTIGSTGADGNIQMAQRAAFLAATVAAQQPVIRPKQPPPGFANF